jgi:hypothetical protein
VPKTRLYHSAEKNKNTPHILLQNYISSSCYISNQPTTCVVGEQIVVSVLWSCQVWDIVQQQLGAGSTVQWFSGRSIYMSLSLYVKRWRCAKIERRKKKITYLQQNTSVTWISSNKSDNYIQWCCVVKTMYSWLIIRCVVGEQIVVSVLWSCQVWDIVQQKLGAGSTVQWFSDRRSIYCVKFGFNPWWWVGFIWSFSCIVTR